MSADRQIIKFKHQGKNVKKEREETTFEYGDEVKERQLLFMYKLCQKFGHRRVSPIFLGSLKNSGSLIRTLYLFLFFYSHKYVTYNSYTQTIGIPLRFVLYKHQLFSLIYQLLLIKVYTSNNIHWYPSNYTELQLLKFQSSFLYHTYSLHW